jgi:pimeloyl-ACP methyl ester carboxylesterase
MRSERRSYNSQTLLMSAVVRASGRILVSIVLCSCTHLASVHPKGPRLPSYDTLPDDLAVVKRQLSNGQRVADKQPLVALGDHLTAARIAVTQLLHHRSEAEARELYNFAVARCVEDLQRAAQAPWHHPVSVPSEDGTFVVSSPSPLDPERDPSNYLLYPADTIKVGSRLITVRSTVKGIGAPIVAVARSVAPEHRARFNPRHLYAPVTAVITFRDHRANLEFFERLSSEQVSIEGQTYPLAGDFTTALALGMARERPNRIGVSALLWPDKYRDRARLIRLQPFDPERTPVVFIHGLASGPLYWTPMINSLISDPEIRRRYQFWVFRYPTGYPFPYSAVQLRHELDSIKQAFPKSKPVVLVGHSLGGVVARLLVTDAGDSIWRAFFGKPPAEMQITSRTGQLLKETLIFNHRPDVKRAIFITTPHRGTTVASHWWTRMAARFIKQPRSFTEIHAMVNADPAAQHLNRIPNCVETLAPDDPFLLALNKFRVAPEIPFHTIEADRGRGDAPNSNDGMVGYWSSHLDGAQSELIVPSNHAAQVHPKGIAEVRRILRSSN